MKRDPTQLADRAFDLLVIGAGINGACVARDAAMRGLSVALIDRGDFVSATSSNSLRIIHGGLRYLQHLDFGRMRQSIRERSNWLRIAPHLVHPLPFLVPTTGRGMRSRAAFRVALWLNDLVGLDRNRGVDPQRRLPRGRVISRAKMLERYHGGDIQQVTGGAIWYDAQMYHSERLVMAVLHDAVDHGARIANYVEASAIALHPDQPAAVDVRDRQTGEPFCIRARVIVNTSGPVIDEMLSAATGRERTSARVPLSKAMNLFTRRMHWPTAVGVAGQHRDPNAAVDHGARLLFVTPWREGSLIGTTHEAYDGPPSAFHPTRRDVQRFVDEINTACPALQLTLDDVAAVYAGLLPSEPSRPGDTDVRLLRHHRMIDHAIHDGIDNVISLIGVKFTTARLAAEQVVSLAHHKLGRRSPECRTALEPVAGGDIASWSDYLHEAQRRHAGRIEPQVVEEIVRLYGTHHAAMLDHLDSREADDKPVSFEQVVVAQVRYAVREEMAMTLEDVVRRRTGLSANGPPDETVVASVAHIMARELNWNATRVTEEVERLTHVNAAWCDDSPSTAVASDAPKPAPDTPTGSAVG